MAFIYIQTRIFIMKKFLLLQLLLQQALMLSAYNIVVDSIYYNITSDSTVAVTYFYLQGNEKHYHGDIVIPEYISYGERIYAVTSVGRQAFFFATHLNSVSLPMSITKIEDGAFSKSGIVSIDIPEGVRELGSAIVECPYLKSVTLPSSMVRIDSSHFITNCLQLEEIVCKAETPPVFADREIFTYFLSRCVLKVPIQSLDSYKTAIGWKECKKIEGF